MAFALQRDKALERIIAKGPGAEWRESGNVARRMGNMALFRSSASGGWRHLFPLLIVDQEVHLFDHGLDVSSFSWTVKR